ncbi:potassium channel family protein [Halomarina pelagica]|uniref:potassium channel family protein n=1 Tax=Halomarina pelagica TaxID=2961599 RepID=UPI0020C24BB3|nr:potassium channel family protein [Halomarina sp. BND7]
MSVAYSVLGVLLLTVGVGDLLWTTLWVEGGAGPLTSRSMPSVWRALKRIGKQRPRVLSLSGPLILVFGLATWLALLWAGWTLVFAGAEGVLVDTREGGPVSWAERFYFVGYSVFTLGNGDFAPRDGVWQIVTVLVTASGMLFVTLSVTYVLSVLDAVTQKRSFASGVSGLGTRSDAIVRTSWNGEAFRGLDLPLNTFTAQLNALTANHKAYPILHYFFSAQRDQAPALSVTILDEALTLLRFGVPERNRPDEILVRNARSSVRNYLATLHEAFITPASRTPPAPTLDSLREAGVPTVSDDEFARSLDALDERRRQLLGLVETDARRWPSRENG